MEQALKWFGVVCVIATALSALLSTVAAAMPEGAGRNRILWLRDRLDALGLDPRKLGRDGSKLALVAVLCLPTVACTSLRKAGFAPSFRGSSPERCESLSDRASLWGAIGTGGAIVAGAGGLAAIPDTSKDARVAITVASVAVGALAAAATLVSKSASESFVSEGCGK